MVLFEKSKDHAVFEIDGTEVVPLQECPPAFNTLSVATTAGASAVGGNGVDNFFIGSALIGTTFSWLDFPDYGKG